MADSSTQINFKYQFALIRGDFLVPILFGSCSGPKNPDGRENVSGTITLNGEPLTAMAGIVFSPLEEGSRDGGQGQITAGKYALTGADGVKPGKYIVPLTPASIDFDKKTGKPADNLRYSSEAKSLWM
ncbi:MAG: hypothetical protein R3C56_00745 [Pirellulaceae bacterium]